MGICCYRRSTYGIICFCQDRIISICMKYFKMTINFFFVPGHRVNKKNYKTTITAENALKTYKLPWQLLFSLSIFSFRLSLKFGTISRKCISYEIKKIYQIWEKLWNYILSFTHFVYCLDCFKMKRKTTINFEHESSQENHVK